MNETRVSYSETPYWDAATYDEARRRLVPDFDAFYGTVGLLLAETGTAAPDVLDLGAGTGLLSAAVLAAVPAARVTLLDGDPAMLEQARRRLGEVPTVVADLTDPLPEGPFDAVVSSLAIHHLADDGKRDLFARILRVLRPGGSFVHAEQVAGPTAALDVRYLERHEQQARALGTDDEEWASYLVRRTHDRCAPLHEQLRWLEEAGFVEVDVAFKHHAFAVYSGVAPTEG